MEVLSAKDKSITSDPRKIAKIAFANMFLHKNDPVDQENIMVTFYDVDYQYRNSFKVTNGKFTPAKFIISNSGVRYRASSPIAVNSINGHTPSPLSTVAVNNTCTAATCSDYSEVGTLYDLDTGEVLYSEILDSWDECTYSDGTVVVLPYGLDPNPTKSKADHKLSTQTNLPVDGTTNKQVGNMCTMKTIEWVSKFFGGSTSAGDALLWLTQTRGYTMIDMLAIINSTGVSVSDLQLMTDHYFTNSSISDLDAIKAAIDAGNPVMASLVTGSDGHEVMLTGYNNSGTVEYFDPQLGTYINVAASAFSNMLQIKSKK